MGIEVRPIQTPSGRARIDMSVVADAIRECMSRGGGEFDLPEGVGPASAESLVISMGGVYRDRNYKVLYLPDWKIRIYKSKRIVQVAPRVEATA